MSVICSQCKASVDIDFSLGKEGIACPFCQATILEREPEEKQDPLMKADEILERFCATVSEKLAQKDQEQVKSGLVKGKGHVHQSMRGSRWLRIVPVTLALAFFLSGSLWIVHQVGAPKEGFQELPPPSVEGIPPIQLQGGTEGENVLKDRVAIPNTTQTSSSLSSDQTSPGKKSVDVSVWNALFQEYAPSSFAKLQPKLVAALKDSHRSSTEVQWMLAEVYGYLGWRGKNKEWISYAHQMAHRLVQLRPNDWQGKRALALALLAAGQYDQALPWARKVLAQFPSDPISKTILGLTQNQGQSTQEGLATLTEAQASNPSVFFVQEAHVKARMESGEWGVAEGLIRNLLKKEPGDLILIQWLCMAMQKQEKWESLIELQASLLQKHQKDPRISVMLAQAYCERGKYYFHKEKFNEGKKMLERGLEMNSSDVSCLGYLASSLFELQEYKQASTLYARAYSLDPTVSNARNLGLSLLENGEYARAEQYLTAVLRAGEDDAALYYHLARVRHAVGDTAESISFLRKALLKDPSYENARILLDRLKGS